ncbi:carbohydrate ABC transporter permease [Faecalispora jeddahensis]|uniref:carbohydrate ABC transporter permease n=1 Tax=Faecalispora jeddahensis TaxID=1414721 RepID=UPI0027BA2DDF|nr:carbohydrate ABC transporter permease [Faecalispora jeddahensis]
MKNKKVILSVIMIVISLILIFPIYILFMTSFKPLKEVFTISLVPQSPTLANYTEVFSSSFMHSILVSFIVATTVTAVALVFHAMAGYAISRLRFPGRTVIFYIMISTMMVPFAVIMVPLFMVVKSFGMTNSYAGLIVPAIFNAYGIFLYRQFFMSFPKELEEAAYMEGCSPAGTFFRIAFPLSKPIIIPLVIAFFLGNWNNYLWPLIVNKKEEFQVVQVALANMVGSGYSTPWNILITSAAVAAIPTFILFLLLQRHLVEGIKMSGIK